MCQTPKILLRVTVDRELSLLEKYGRLKLPTKKIRFFKENFCKSGAIVAHESVFWSYLPLRTSKFVVILLVDG